MGLSAIAEWLFKTPEPVYTDGLFQQVLYFKDFFCSL